MKKAAAAVLPEDRFVSARGHTKLVVSTIERLQAEKPRTSRELAKAFVDASRSPKSLTHGLFGDMWNDERTAERARIDYAARIIASVRIVFCEQPDKQPVQWQPVVLDGGAYRRVPIRQVMASPDLMSSLVERALADAQGWVRRHERLRDIAELGPVFAAIDGASNKRRKSKRP